MIRRFGIRNPFGTASFRRGAVLNAMAFEAAILYQRHSDLLSVAISTVIFHWTTRCFRDFAMEFYYRRSECTARSAFTLCSTFSALMTASSRGLFRCSAFASDSASQKFRHDTVRLPSLVSA